MNADLTVAATAEESLTSTFLAATAAAFTSITTNGGEAERDIKREFAAETSSVTMPSEAAEAENPVHDFNSIVGDFDASANSSSFLSSFPLLMPPTTSANDFRGGEATDFENGAEHGHNNGNGILFQQHQLFTSESSRPSSCHPKEELADSGDDLPPPDETDDAPVHEIRCGLLIARLHMRRFTCPGIHRKCVEFEGKLISPRQFTIKAEKDKQKDWKGSIRLGKHNLRTLMEMKTLDFFEHATNCSLKCQSRNYIKNRKNENGSNAGSEGGVQQGHTFAEGQEGRIATIGLELGEHNEIKSVASSSSAASTRKSSAAVLEDYVSQTIPSMGFGYGTHADQMLLNGLGNTGEEITSQNGQKTPQPAISSSSAHQMPMTPSSRTTTAPTPVHHQNGHSSVHQQQSPFHPSNGSLSLLQQSPLKHLFGTKNPPGTHQPFQPSQLASHQQPNFPVFPNGTQKHSLGRASAGSLLPPDGSQDAALAILLQSVQTSILLEQQQKAAAAAAHHQQQQQGHVNGGNALLAQLASLGALHPAQTGTAGSQAMGGGPMNGGANGIERLLAAAALFPQLQPPSQQQQQKTPIKEPVNVQNIRRSMEENPTNFWAQMRSMGLLEDMLRTLGDTLDKLKQIYMNGGNPVSEEFAAQRLSGVALAMDLCSLFGEKIHSRYIQATLESTLINKEILELQRKQEEQKRKLENAKRKSQVFDQLLKNGTHSVGNNGQANIGGQNNGAGAGANNSNGAPELKKIHLNS